MTRWQRILLVLLYALATLQCARVYLLSTRQWLRMDRYLAGTERMPFQGRVLAAPLIRWLSSMAPLAHASAGRKGALAGSGMPAVLVISVVALALAGCCAVLLYRLFSRDRSLEALVYPVFLAAFYVSYAMHGEHNYAYPYDTLGLAFFTAGLYFVVAEKYLPLLLVVAIGSWNRETTLFLVPLFLLHSVLNLRKRDWPVWCRAAALAVIWAAVHMYVGHTYRFNDHSEDYFRLAENIRYLSKPTNWSEALNIIGYMLPCVLLLRRSLPQNVRNLLWIMPVWVIVMLGAGVIVETRIYGELSSLTAVCAVLLVEHYATRSGTPSLPDAARIATQTSTFQAQHTPARQPVPAGGGAA